jgi:hypothetical protein
MAAWVATGIKVGSMVTPSMKKVKPGPSETQRHVTGKLHSYDARLRGMACRQDFKLHDRVWNVTWS